MSNNIKTRDELTISDNKEKSLKNFILEWSEIIFKVGLIVGSIIAFCFYFFYVGAMPSIGSVGDTTIFIIMIACIGSFIVAIFTFMSLPTLFFDDKRYAKYLRKTIILWNWIIWIFNLIIKIFNKMKKEKISNFNGKVKESTIFFIAVAFSTIILILETKYLIIKKNLFNYQEWMILIYIAIPSIVFKIKNSDTPFITYIVFQFAMTVYLLLFTGINDKNVTVIFLLVFLISVILFNIMILKVIHEKIDISYKIIPIEKAKNLISKSQQDKNFYILFPIISGVFLIMIQSIVWSAQQVDNIFITKPFEMLKLGHYNAILQFKDDFIQKNNPFESNKNNCEQGIFFIRSSLGDEYILEELKKHEEYEKNKENKKNISIYRIKKEFVVSETKTDNNIEHWTKNCNSYEKVTFQKDFIKKNNPFPENKKGCLTKVFWVQDKGSTLELKESTGIGDEPYQILSSYIVSRQKVKEASRTWLDCPSKKYNSNIFPSFVYQIKYETK